MPPADPTQRTITLTLDELRLVGLWAADCAQRVLPLFQAMASTDTRPNEAIEGIRVFASGGRRTAHLRSLAMGAHAAARQVKDPSAAAAARAAGVAAATAYTHPLATTDQAKHILGSAAYAALARELAAGGHPEDAVDELRWALGHVSPEVCDVLRRFPARSLGRSRLDELYYLVDQGLRVTTDTGRQSP